MPEEKSELDKFLGDIGHDAPKLEEAPNREEAPQEETEEKPEEGEPKLNRQQRRQIENASIRKQLQEEHDARIAAEARAKALAETKRDGDVDERLLQLYGDTENGKLAAKLHAEMLADVEKRATESAYSRIQSEQQAAQEEERRAAAYIDDQLAAVEEVAGIDLTSNAPAARKARAELLEVVERLSPKDEDGNIKDYADFGAAFEMYQASKKPVANQRRNEIASRSIAKSGEPNLAKEEADTNRSWLRSVGIKI